MSYNPSSGGSPAWSSVTGKPSTFPPETPQAISHITGLQTALDGKQAAGSYQPLATVLTNTTAAFTTAQETKLAGIATSATANSPDATLLSRANHTGSQASSTISDFTEASQDIIGAMFVAAGGTYDDALGTVGFPASSGGSSGPYAAMMLASNYTLTSTTAQQKLFNLGTSSGGEVLLETGIYKTRIQLYITSMSATAGNGIFSILGAGTATLGKSMRHSVGVDNTTPTTALTQNGAWSLNTATNNMAANNTGTAMAVTIEGILHVTVAGTVIPSIALTTAAAAIVNAPSYIVFERLAGIGTTTIGTVT